jgi:hypothetical protein
MYIKPIIPNIAGLEDNSGPAMFLLPIIYLVAVAVNDSIVLPAMVVYSQSMLVEPEKVPVPLTVNPCATSCEGMVMRSFVTMP